MSQKGTSICEKTVETLFPKKNEGQEEASDRGNHTCKALKFRGSIIFREQEELSISRT